MVHEYFYIHTSFMCTSNWARMNSEPIIVMDYGHCYGHWLLSWLHVWWMYGPCSTLLCFNLIQVQVEELEQLQYFASKWNSVLQLNLFNLQFLHSAKEIGGFTTYMSHIHTSTYILHTTVHTCTWHTWPTCMYTYHRYYYCITVLHVKWFLSYLQFT